MLFNVFYMFRRIGMAFILVVLPNLNWLQRQMLILKCSCLMFFTGHVKPFKQKHHNVLEIINECLILVNTYFMIIYSGFIPDAHVKYSMGWANLSIIVCMVVVNLIELMAIKGYRVYRTGKLKIMGWQWKKKVKKYVVQKQVEKKMKELDEKLEQQFGSKPMENVNNE